MVFEDKYVITKERYTDIDMKLTWIFRGGFLQRRRQAKAGFSRDAIGTLEIGPNLLHKLTTDIVCSV